MPTLMIAPKCTVHTHTPPRRDLVCLSLTTIVASPPTPELTDLIKVKSRLNFSDLYITDYLVDITLVQFD